MRLKICLILLTTISDKSAIARNKRFSAAGFPCSGNLQKQIRKYPVERIDEDKR